jgi:transcriptional regulator with XRE-family HTH domain
MQAMISDEQTIDRLSGNLSRLMQQRGFSQHELSRRSGEPVMNINRIINRRNQPLVATVMRLAEALDATPNDLLGSDNLSNPKPRKALGATQKNSA